MDILLEPQERPTKKHLSRKPQGQLAKNFVVLEDAYTASGWYRASFMLALEWSGWQIGEPHLQTGMTLTRSWDRRLKDRLLRCHYFSAYNLDDKHLDEILKRLIVSTEMTFGGYPGGLFYLPDVPRKWVESASVCRNLG